MNISKMTRRLRFKQEQRRVKIDLTGPETLERSPERPKPLWDDNFQPKPAGRSSQPPINTSFAKVEAKKSQEPATVREAFEIFKRNQETA